MNIAEHIEHTLLKPEATVQDIIKLCQEAKDAGLFGVCINPCYVALAKHLLTGTKIKIITVIGFPLGATYTEVKALETKMAIENHGPGLDITLGVLGEEKFDGFECYHSGHNLEDTANLVRYCHADEALYKIKDRGRNGYCLCGKEPITLS